MHPHSEKITTLHQEFTNQQTLAQIRRQKYARRVKLRTATIIAAGVFGMTVSAYPLVKNHFRSSRYEAAYEENVERLSELTKQREDLEYQVTLLENEDYIAKMARAEFSLSKKGETVFKLPQSALEQVEQAAEQDE